MLNEKQRQQANIILREISALEKQFLEWCKTDITVLDFNDDSFIQDFDKICISRSKIADLKGQLAKLYILHG